MKRKYINGDKMHRINLDKFNLRSDLVNDIENKSINVDVKKYKNIKVEKTYINKELSRKILKKEGNYISIIFDDDTDSEMANKIKKVACEELRNLLEKKSLIGKKSLVVGLGNIESTPDSLGPKVIDKVIATRHLYELSDIDNKYSCVAKISPGVYATTGIESFDIIKGIVKKINPDFLIIVDALCSTSVKKLNKVIQITDSAITPGSGVENHRKELSKRTIGKEIITIGVPTVVNLHTIVRYFLNEYEIEEILKEKGNNFLVTPKNIDFEIEKLSFIISNSINNTLHNLTK